MTHLKKIQQALTMQAIDALLLHDRQSKRYVGALPGSGGVRIEDDVLITDTGAQVLNQTSKDLMLLEDQEYESV